MISTGSNIEITNVSRLRTVRRKHLRTITQLSAHTRTTGAVIAHRFP
ncbi:hypothetical protein [Nocardia wallacei]|nr:hypothetical protein [Nocardia wallacei]